MQSLTVGSKNVNFKSVGMGKHCQTLSEKDIRIWVDRFNVGLMSGRLALRSIAYREHLLLCASQTTSAVLYSATETTI